MDSLIIVKWLTDWSQPGIGEPPSVITNMIGMFLGFGEVQGQELIPGQ